MKPKGLILSLVGVAGLAACITAASLEMRVVMGIGGFCASGGPYQIAVQCPDSTWLLTVSIFAGLIFAGLTFFGPIGKVSVGGLAWSALFLAFGWNFLDFGLPWHGQSAEAGWLICGVMFAIMGLVPLFFVIPDLLRTIKNGVPDTSKPPMFPSVVRAAVNVAAQGGTDQLLTTPSFPATPTTPPKDLTGELERLAELHRTGDLDVIQYETAKAKLLGGGS